MDSDPSAIPSRLLEDVRAILQQARQKTFATANTLMVEAYWLIGQRIVQEEQGGNARADYGSQLIPNLARQLGDEFRRSVSIANLKNFRQFYLTFPDAGKSYALRSFLTWTHWRLVMRVENAAARDYYIRETAGQSWSSRQLERAIATQTFQRLLQPRPPTRQPAPSILRNSSKIPTCSNSSACRKCNAPGKPATLPLQISPRSPQRGRAA